MMRSSDEEDPTNHLWFFITYTDSLPVSVTVSIIRPNYSRTLGSSHYITEERLEGFLNASNGLVMSLLIE